MTPNTTTAAAEAAKNIEIYNALADIAREVFNHLNGAEEGKIYTPADIARAIVGGPVVTCVNGLNYRCDRVEKYEIGGFSWSEDYDPETAYTVENGGFSCRVIAWKIFDVVDRAARSLDIPAAARVTFERPRAAAPIVVSFTLSAAAARELAACCAKDQLRPVMNGVHVDTRRRVLVASDGHVLRVIKMGAALTVDESAAAPSYIVPADVIKSGRVVTIDANDIAATDKKSAPCIAGRFPNWAAVVPAVSDAGRVALTADQWKQLKKAVATAATVHPSGKYGDHHVIIAHEFMSDVLHVYSYNYDFSRERDIIVPVDNCRDQFSIRFEADDFKRIGGNVTALYLRDQSRAIVTTDAAGLSLVMPKLQNTDDKYNMYFSFAEGAAELLQGIDIAAAAAEIKEEHIKAAAADIVADVREKCEGKSAAKMLKYMNDNYGWSDALNMARDILAAEIAAETAAANETPAPAADVFEAVSVETTAAPAADQTTPAEAVSDRENDRNDNESDTPAETITDDTNETTDAPALTLPPLAVLLTTTDDRAPLSLTLPTPAPVLLLPLLTSNTATASETITNETTTDGDTAAPWSSPFATLPELPTTDNTADTADASELLTITTTDATPAADPDESDRPAVTVAANFARRARRWFHVAAAVLAVLIITAAPVAITDNESDTPAAVLTINPDTLTANDTPAAAVLAVSEAVSVETTAAPAADRPAVRKRHHAPQNERHHRRAIVPDTLAAAVLTITPDTLTADTLTAPALAADTLESVRNITENADTLEHARDITVAPAADIDTDNDTPAEAVTASENDDDAPAEVISTDTANDGTPAPSSETPATGGTTGTPSPSTPATTGTPAPVPLSPAVLAWLLTL